MLAKLFGSKIAVGVLVGSVAAGGAFAAVEGLPNVFSGSPVDEPKPVVPYISTSPGSTVAPESEPTTEPPAEPPAEPTAPTDEDSAEPTGPVRTSSTPAERGDEEATGSTNVPRLPIVPSDEPDIVPDLPVLPTPDLPGVEPPGASDDDGDDLLEEALDITDR
jgi:hypothetical protein